MFFMMLIWGNRLNCWNTIPIFRLSRLISVFLSVISVPSKKIWPPVGSSSRFMHRRNVDFPEPDGPTTNTTSPFLMVVVMFFSTSTPSKDLHNSFTWISGSPAPISRFFV